MGDHRPSLFLQSKLCFPSLAPLSLCITAFLISIDVPSFFPSFFSVSSLFCSLPFALLSLYLTAVRLLWEVIRKNSTETHTAAAENKVSNTFCSLLAWQLQKARSQVRRMIKEGFTGSARTTLGRVVGGLAAVVIPHFYAVGCLAQDLNMSTFSCVTQKRKVLCGFVEQTGWFWQRFWSKKWKFSLSFFFDKKRLVSFKLLIYLRKLHVFGYVSFLRISLESVDGF